MAPAHARAVKGNARDDIVKGIAVEGDIRPAQSLILALHPKGVGECQTADHADKVMARDQAQLAHQLLYGAAVLGNLAAVNPVVDICKAIRKIGVKLFDKLVVEIVDLLAFCVRGDDNVFVH